MVRGLARVVSGAVISAAVAGCSVAGAGREECTAGRFDPFVVGEAATADGALDLFLGSLDAAGMPRDGWHEVSTSAHAVVFRNGSNQATAVQNPDGWDVIAYTTCAS